MYKIVRSTDNGLDEIELDQLEKGYWLDIVAPSEDELAACLLYTSPSPRD